MRTITRPPGWSRSPAGQATTGPPPAPLVPPAAGTHDHAQARVRVMAAGPVRRAAPFRRPGRNLRGTGRSAPAKRTANGSFPLSLAAGDHRGTARTDMAQQPAHDLEMEPLGADQLAIKLRSEPRHVGVSGRDDPRRG